MEPECIKKLDESVVNRIAAGEIIQRPANALKEMIENSIDAKSTTIQITVKSGGLKYLQIQDNGTGIRTDDLPILCERFTTSKLKIFEDLSTISTYGFRGEALASISHVAHLTITTKTINDKCGYRAAYKDGNLVEKPKPTACNQGTQITVEDLFYNVRQRRQALSSPYEEYQRILDVVTKYAIHNTNIGMGLKKYGENQHLKTQPNSTIEKNINILYGNEIAKELMEMHVNDGTLGFNMTALITNANYSSKKLMFLLFINNRLVESAGIKVAIDQVYSMYLPKGRHPFVYMSLDIESTNVDVNIHPTKHEVHFLHEEIIIERIKDALETKLIGNNASRTFLVQSLLPGAEELTKKSTENDNDLEKKTKVYAKDLVRSDSKEQKLDKFYGNVSLSQSLNNDGTKSSNIIQSKKLNIIRKDTKLTSILDLRKHLEQSCHIGLRQTLTNFTFVGCISRTHALIQHKISLYLTNTKMLAEELFYQLLLYDFENFGTFSFENSLSIYELAVLALNCDASGWTIDDGPKEDLALSVKNILIDKAPILKEYYNLTISSDGCLETLPILLDGHIPSMTQLPMYILRLATEVDWTDERLCFETLSRETATFYAEFDDNNCVTQQNENDWKWIHEHILYSAFKKFLIPSDVFMKNQCFLQIAKLPNLYKVFERC